MHDTRSIEDVADHADTTPEGRLEQGVQRKIHLVCTKLPYLLKRVLLEGCGLLLRLEGFDAISLPHEWLEAEPCNACFIHPWTKPMKIQAAVRLCQALSCAVAALSHPIHPVRLHFCSLCVNAGVSGKWFPIAFSMAGSKDLSDSPHSCKI